VWPRALSTFGRLNKLNSDIFEADRSSFGTLGVGEGSRRIAEVRPIAEDDRDSESRGMVGVRPKRHLDVEGGSCTRLRTLLAGDVLSPLVLYVAR
jgi:hypothetical protein